MSKIFYSLSGLPRSGSTLLSSILNQHPQIHCSETSCVLDILSDSSDSVMKQRHNYNISEEQEIRLYKSILHSFYDTIDKPIIFDKNRGWPKAAKRELITGQRKMICTTRPIAEIVSSYILLLDKTVVGTSFIDKHLNSCYRPITTRNRAMCVWDGYLLKPYEVMKTALKTIRDDILLISYDNICNDTDTVMERVHSFFSINSSFTYNYSNIKHINSERDEEGWGIKGLHDIRPLVKRTSKPPQEIIGEELTAYFSKFDL